MSTDFAYMLDSEEPRAVGTRLRQVRLANAMSQDDVVERLDHFISKAALSKYELSHHVPSASMLPRLADALNTTTAYLLSQEQTSVDWDGRCFEVQRIGSRKREQLTAMASTTLELHLDLVRLFSLESQRAVPAPMPVRDLDDVESAAGRVRESLGVVDTAIDSLTALLEDRGAVVLYVPVRIASSFHGLSGHSNDITVALVRHSEHDEQRRADLAHILGMITMDCGSIPIADRARFVRSFQMAFLAPREIVWRELGTKRRHLSVPELLILQRRYGVPPDVWACRAYDLDIVTKRTFDIVRQDLRCIPEYDAHSAGVVDEEPIRRRLLALRALTEGLVSREWLRRLPWFEREALLEREGLLVEEPSEKRSEADLLMQLPLEDRHALMRKHAADAAAFYRREQGAGAARGRQRSVHKYAGDK